MAQHLRGASEEGLAGDTLAQERDEEGSGGIGGGLPLLIHYQGDIVYPFSADLHVCHAAEAHPTPAFQAGNERMMSYSGHMSVTKVT
jgi:hypothetical protein